jgi:hypothetical protein
MNVVRINAPRRRVAIIAAVVLSGTCVLATIAGPAAGGSATNGGETQVDTNCRSTFPFAAVAPDEAALSSTYTLTFPSITIPQPPGPYGEIAWTYSIYGANFVAGSAVVNGDAMLDGQDRPFSATIDNDHITLTASNLDLVDVTLVTPSVTAQVTAPGIDTDVPVYADNVAIAQTPRSRALRTVRRARSRPRVSVPAPRRAPRRPRRCRRVRDCM